MAKLNRTCKDCGHDEVYVRQVDDFMDEGYKAVCDICGAESKTHESKTGAIEDWNTNYAKTETKGQEGK